MINTNELRIGNYINVDNVMRKVCCIKNDEEASQPSSIGYMHNNTCEYETSVSDRIQAIPITDALLTSLGFTFQNYYKLWQHKRPTRTMTIELNKDYSAVDFAHQTMVKHVGFLHRLQNLFFSLQQQELAFQ